MNSVTNQMQLATSPYLLQHKDNPVAWQFWTPETLQLAHQQNKPILLSIGYSACHWCHVMARESFADDETADVMNSSFINIKVDREERPDIDDVYQTAHQLLTGRAGGWPLTVFLCPRTQLPFLIGTYFPKVGNGAQLGFLDLMGKVNDYYHSRGKDFIDTLDQVRSRYRELTLGENTLDPDATLSEIPIIKAAGDLLKEADLLQGGFGHAPKFPMPTSLERLFVTLLTDSPARDAAAAHLHNTLVVMARSGICDQVGGGFFRYSTDTHWTLPHFEKMLYDNGLLLSVYAQGYTVFREPILEYAARGIAQWALEHMRADGGGFFGSLDADSDQKEGAYYLWDTAEIAEVLDAEENGVMHAVYDLDKYPGFNNLWHLHRSRTWKSITHELEMDEDQAITLLGSALKKLRAHRSQRELPFRDTKILTSWNGLFIRGLAMSARIFRDETFLVAAAEAVDFIRQNLWVNQRLYATWQAGSAKVHGFLPDYAYLMDALLEMLQTRWRDEDYRFLSGLAESLLEHFEDTEHGGFYFTAHDQEQLVTRSKPFFDGVLPSGNGIAAKVFGRFSHLCAEPRYLDAARKTLLSGWGSMLRTPKAHHACLLALADYLKSPPQVLLKGGTDMGMWQTSIQQIYGEQVHCYWIPDSSEIHPPELFLLDSNQGLICVGDHCLEPHDKLDELMVQLAEVIAGNEIIEAHD